jgi:hypothetical protein
MRREAPVRFLGGGSAEMRCCYPTPPIFPASAQSQHWRGVSRLKTVVLAISAFSGWNELQMNLSGYAAFNSSRNTFRSASTVSGSASG